MTTKQILLSALILGITCNIALAMQKKIEPETLQQKEYLVYVDQNSCRVEGTVAFAWERSDGSIEFPICKHTKVIKLSSNEEFKEIGTLQSKEMGNIILQALKDKSVFCPTVTQIQYGKKGKLEDVGAIIYPTEDPKYCDLLVEYLTQKNKNL